MNLRDRARAGRDQLEWRWESGSATPGATEALQGDIALCMYGESERGPARLFRSLVPGEVACRRKRSALNCRRRGHPAEHNTMSVVLRAGRDGRTTLVATAEGSGMSMPAMPLPLPLRVQLQTTQGGCWEATYTAHDSSKNTARRFGAHN